MKQIEGKEEKMTRKTKHLRGRQRRRLEKFEDKPQKEIYKNQWQNW